jgi:hypothetical protein
MIVFCNNESEGQGWVISPALYSGGPRFRYRSGDRLLCLRVFAFFLSPSMQIPV